MVNLCRGVCVRSEPLPAADELQKERNLLGPAVLAHDHSSDWLGCTALSLSIVLGEERLLFGVLVPGFFLFLS